jgi:hypothetical protein
MDLLEEFWEQETLLVVIIHNTIYPNLGFKKTESKTNLSILLYCLLPIFTIKLTI